MRFKNATVEIEDESLRIEFEGRARNPLRWVLDHAVIIGFVVVLVALYIPNYSISNWGPTPWKAINLLLACGIFAWGCWAFLVSFCADLNSDRSESLTLYPPKPGRRAIVVQHSTMLREAIWYSVDASTISRVSVERSPGDSDEHFCAFFIDDLIELTAGRGIEEQRLHELAEQIRAFMIERMGIRLEV